MSAGSDREGGASGFEDGFVHGARRNGVTDLDRPAWQGARQGAGQWIGREPEAAVDHGCALDRPLHPGVPIFEHDTGRA